MKMTRLALDLFQDGRLFQDNTLLLSSIDVLVPHLANEAGLWPLLAQALPAGDRGRVVLALLGRETFEEHA